MPDAIVFSSRWSHLSYSHYPLAEQSGVLATLSRWRSWVQIPSRGLTRRGTQLAKRQSSNLCDFVGSTPTRATAMTSIARMASVRETCVIANENASAGHWRFGHRSVIGR